MAVGIGWSIVSDRIAMTLIGKIAGTLRRGAVGLWRDESGVAMLETVLVFPLQLLLTMLIVQVAMIFVGANVVNYASFQAVRTAVVTMRSDDIDARTQSAADMAAWVVCSTLHNTTNDHNRSNRQKIRTYEYNYYFPKDMSARLEGTLRVEHTEGSPEISMVEYEAKFWMPLAVPLGAQTIAMLMPSGDSAGSVKKILGFPSLCMVQRTAIPKVWPY